MLGDEPKHMLARLKTHWLAHQAAAAGIAVNPEVKTARHDTMLNSVFAKDICEALEKVDFKHVPTEAPHTHT